MKKYQDIKADKQKRIDALLSECGFFAAFSQEQFDEGKTPLADGDTYIRFGSGCFMPKSNFAKFETQYDQINNEFDLLIDAENANNDQILYELNNHECFYTGDLTPVLDLFAGRYTKEQIVSVYRAERNLH